MIKSSDYQIPELFYRTSQVKKDPTPKDDSVFVRPIEPLEIPGVLLYQSDTSSRVEIFPDSRSAGKISWLRKSETF
jgi:hypothetical protein